jgi:hypothetical protein
MEIVSLKLWLSEEDLNKLIAKHTPPDQPIRDLQVKLHPEGVRVTGAYPVTFFNVRFDTLWALSVQAGRLVAHLAELKVAGAPAGLVRGMLMEMLGAQLEEEEGVRVEGENIVVDPDALIGRLGLTGRTNLTAVRCEAGRIVIEAGTPS